MGMEVRTVPHMVQVLVMSLLSKVILFVCKDFANSFITQCIKVQCYSYSHSTWLCVFMCVCVCVWVGGCACVCVNISIRIID